MKAKSPKAKVWEVLSKNEKPFETPNHKYHSHTCTVTRKIVPIFVDDDFKIIEREKIINMHNVFMKETNNEYTEKHMNNLFNMLFENKKHYKAKRNNFTKTSHEFLPFLKSKSPKTTTNKQIHTDNNNVDTKEFEPYDSEIEENIKNDIYNRNKIVIKLRKKLMISIVSDLYSRDKKGEKFKKRYKRFYKSYIFKRNRLEKSQKLKCPTLMQQALKPQ